MSLISIIIPVYNTEQYLSGCLDSIIENNFNDIEIIVVNDGSSGRIKDIIDYYKKKYTNIKYISLKKNSGVLIARDVAIRQAKSKYIMCINSDDYIEKNTLKELEKETQNDYDIIAFDYVHEKDNKRRESPYYEYEISTNLVITDSVKNVGIVLQKRIFNLNCKLIKKELYDKIKIENKYINYLNGYLITPKLFYYAKSIKYNTSKYYICRYRINTMSNLHNITFNQKETLLNTIAYISNDIYSFLKNENIFDSLESEIANFEYTTHGIMYSDITSNLSKSQIKHINILFSEALPCLKKYHDILNKIEYAKCINPSVSLSVVIPVFNTEVYLPRCLDSILLKQSYKDMEIIIVDDYSTGNCKEIVEQYQSNGYSNIIYVKNTENLGSAWARVNGASYSKGKYIHFIDSDDWLMEECYQEQMKLLNDKFDALYFNHYLAYENNVIVENYNKIINTTLRGKRAAFDDMFLNPLERARTLWSRIFSRKCVLNATKHMPKIWISIADDWIFNLFILFYVNKYKSVSGYFYCYYQDNPMAMTTTAENGSNVNSQKLNKLITQYYLASYSLINFFVDKGIWNTYRINWSVYIATDLQHHFINTLTGFERNILDSNDKKIIRNECDNFLKNKTSLSYIFSFIRYNSYLSHQLSIRKFNQFAFESFSYKIISTLLSPVKVLRNVFNINETDNKTYIKLLGFNITLIKNKLKDKKHV